MDTTSALDPICVTDLTRCGGGGGGVYFPLGP